MIREVVPRAAGTDWTPADADDVGSGSYWAGQPPFLGDLRRSAEGKRGQETVKVQLDDLRAPVQNMETPADGDDTGGGAKGGDPVENMETPADGDDTGGGAKGGDPVETPAENFSQSCPIVYRTPSFLKKRAARSWYFLRAAPPSRFYVLYGPQFSLVEGFRVVEDHPWGDLSTPEARHRR
jgi:hypothetical protein